MIRGLLNLHHKIIFKLNPLKSVNSISCAKLDIKLKKELTKKCPKT